MTPIFSLPMLLVGPILRRTDKSSVTMWLVLTQPLSLSIIATAEESRAPLQGKTLQRKTQIGRSALNWFTKRRTMKIKTQIRLNVRYLLPLVTPLNLKKK